MSNILENETLRAVFALVHASSELGYFFIIFFSHNLRLFWGICVGKIFPPTARGYYVTSFLPAFFRNSRESGYKLWVQWFLGSFGWTSVSYDWSIVFKATITHSQVMLVYPQFSFFILRNRCAESLKPFLLWFLEWGIRLAAVRVPSPKIWNWNCTLLK